MTDLYARSAFSGEIVLARFDFADFFERRDIRFAEFTPLLEAGLTLVSRRESGTKITLWLLAGNAGQSYLYGVRADAEGGVSDTQLRMLNVRAATPPESVTPPDGVLYLVNAAGELLLNAADEALHIG